ncbi:hypothetical protein [Lactiplantibacillus mudanjiangensis]|uniref:Uncharacterized protein n=1 Tax=Lactiplantibacillus mudanjiangensis TaxID=1296538 RepID=A0A660E411_9LACO|nr:hypothetical protein [Lactiplantibacillus mudanjiangensis]VDG18491.1 hypothetical protein MUDAN_BIHEEGNE_03354 [Lactiplantibacillus mudanjiangensis]VDG25917.1 hypothetical protein MUDAN_IGPPGNFN_01362 [Lactiplantibacillus mudanjiangensis]VDG28857.1 hypothetical protein MUDAN_MDHGFNIF_03262 [Lactiplantibacillus mudanjiangensis]VDG33749.1 hypothetical protein MUDAN_DOGOELCO_02885 [Lactiplantibacillus mudanjiangensis]
MRKWIKWLLVGCLLLLLGVGAVYEHAQQGTSAQAKTKALPKNEGKVIVYYRYGKKGSSHKSVYETKTLTGKVGTTYHTYAADLLNNYNWMVLHSHSKNVTGTYTHKKTTKVYYDYWDVVEKNYEFKHGADLLLELTADHRIGGFDRNLQDGVEMVAQRPSFKQSYYEVTYSERGDTSGEGKNDSGLKEFRYRLGTTHRYKDPRNGNIYTLVITKKGGITFHAVATKGSTMDELVKVNARGKLVKAEIKK